jgi:hypothetical protein
MPEEGTAGIADHADSEDAVGSFYKASRRGNNWVAVMEKLSRHPQNPRDPQFPLFLRASTLTVAIE